jgi:hypothetical protein
MKKLFFTTISLAILILPEVSCAHGFVDDGHHGPTWVDYLEFGGIVLVSVGLILFSFLGTRKDKK